MKLSIIIPNYNNSKTVLKTIESIYSSKNINKIQHEIIIIDDASNDNSIEIIEGKFPTVKLIKITTRSGAARSRNTGINLSKGNLILFIDGDVWLNKNTIASLIKFLDKETDIAFPKIVFENGKIFYPNFDIEKKFPHISACFLIKKKSLEKLDEYFDDFYHTYLEDYDFFIRCSLAELNAKYVEQARVTHENKDKIRDYSERYYFEIRNTLYGKKKFSNLAKKSVVANPFTTKNVIKELFLGLFNFAWFNWFAYDRKLNKIEKIKLMLRSRNKIFLRKNKTISLFIKALKDISQNRKEIKLKRKKIINFYLK